MNILRKKKIIHDKDDNNFKNDNFEVTFNHEIEKEDEVKMRNSANTNVYDDMISSEDEEDEHFKVQPLNEYSGKKKYSNKKKEEPKNFDFDSI